MKINKELKYNILILVVLFVLDFMEKLVLGSKSIDDLSSKYIFSLMMTFNVCRVLVYYINYRFATPLLSQKKYVLYILSFLGMVMLFVVVRFTLEEVILFKLTGKHNYGIEYIKNNEYLGLIKTYMYDSFYYTLRVCLYSSIAYLLFRFYENKEKIHQLNLQNQQAQLSTLKSQISPHFLFNTLNNFYVDLVDDKPETAKDILKLSNLMRYVTYETSEDFVSLKKEIDFIKDYIHFFKRRYEDNLHIQFSVNGKVESQQIPALILIHFIENVCKHGIINDKNRPAKIGINITDDTIEVITENYISTSEKYMETGIGTENIKKRLDVLFEDNYTLTNQKNNGIFKSYLKMPIQ